MLQPFRLLVFTGYEGILSPHKMRSVHSSCFASSLTLSPHRYYPSHPPPVAGTALTWAPQKFSISISFLSVSSRTRAAQQQPRHCRYPCPRADSGRPCSPTATRGTPSPTQRPSNPLVPNYCHPTDAPSHPRNCPACLHPTTSSSLRHRDADSCGDDNDDDSTTTTTV
ncbi:hypothetical protein EDB85DRAFT_1980533, partial [Lactarius pseudohatsudake]